MRTISIFAALVFLFVGNTSAQEIFPEQFYTDGAKFNGWKRVGLAHYSLLFARYRPDDLTYRQQILSFRDSEANHIYVQDARTKKFYGRFDLVSGSYSVLPEQWRLVNRNEIPESAFPKPGPLPTIEELFKQPGDGPGSQSRVMIPPPTGAYPRLETSRWDSVQLGETKQFEATIQFNGGTGTFYQNGRVGHFWDVTYAVNGYVGYLITGKWSLDRLHGTFAFNVEHADVNSFTGGYTIGDGDLTRVWSGQRITSNRRKPEQAGIQAEP